MRNRLRGVFLLLAVFALVAASCSSDDADDTTTTAAAATTTTAAATTTTAGGTDTTAATTTTAAEIGIESNPDEGVTDSAIKLGFMGDITGPTAATQLFFERGISCYLDFANSQGGVADREFELFTEDDAFSVEDAVVNFQKLVEDDQVIAILGQGGSHIMSAIDVDVADAGVPFIGPQQTIDIQFANPYVFNVLAHYGDQADVAVARMIEDVGGAENLVVASIGLEVASGLEWGVYVKDTTEKLGATYTEHINVPITGTEADAQVIRIEELIDSDGLNYLALHGSPGAALRVLNSMDAAGVDLPIGGIFATIAENVFIEGPADLIDTFWGVHTYTPSNVSTPGNDELNAFVAGTACEEFASNVNFVGGWVVAKLAVEGVKRAAADGTLGRQVLADAIKRIDDFDTGGQSPALSCTREGSHCGAAARPYEWDGTGLQPVGEFADWSDTLDLIYGLG